jgi:hypothetical protein
VSGLTKKFANSGSVLRKIYSVANIDNLENKKYIKYFICTYETLGVWDHDTEIALKRL